MVERGGFVKTGETMQSDASGRECDNTGMLLTLHPTGNANVRQALQAFAEASLLREFHTGVSFRPGGMLDRMAPRKLRAELRRRSFPDCVQPYIQAHPMREMGRLACQALRLRGPVAHEKGIFSVDAVYRDLDRRVAARLRNMPQAVAVYGYEDGAADCFAVARQRGWPTLYDLPIGHWRAGQTLFREEAGLQPEWAPTLTGAMDSPEKLHRKDLELQQADAVIVASSFTRSTLEGQLGANVPVHVIPYGAPPARAASRELTRPEDPLRVFFAGTLSQRKGLSYFLRACELAGRAVVVTIIGRRQGGACTPLETALRRHRYIESLPHAQMLEEMARQDVMVFPSLFEGFGLVILEAMAQGVPVITTQATGGPEVLADGQEGFIVPLRDAEAIADRLLALHRDRKLLQAMGEAARIRAAGLVWSRYRDALVAVARDAAAGLA